MSEQWKVRFLDLVPDPDTLRIDETTFHAVLKGGKFILDGAVEAFERNFADYHGVKHCIGVGNGFDALQIIMRCMGIGNGDRVLVPSNAPLPVYMSVSALGASPIPIEPYTYGHVLDPLWLVKSNTIKSKSKNLKAVIAVHLYGMVAPIEALKEVCEGLPIIEDCCQAHGATFRGEAVGSFGVAGAFSFYPTKNMGAYGDAGAIITNDDGLAEAARNIREYGKGKRVGINSRLDELHAALLNFRLLELRVENECRRERAELYASELQGSSDDNLYLPLPIDKSKPVYHQFVVLCEARDALKSFLEKHGIETMIHYPTPAWKMDYYKGVWNFPISLWQSKRVLSLPIGKGVTTNDVEYVCERIRTFYAEKE